MNWLSFIPTAFAAAAILLVPGLIVAYALRMRGLWMMAAAAPVSVSLISVAALASPFVDIAWSFVPVLVLTAVAALAAWIWARWAGARSPRHRLNSSRGWFTAVAVLVPAALITFVLVRSMQSPEYLSQRYDNFFHLNAVQYVLDTANASPLWLGTMTSGETGELPFYPSGWHAVVSLVVMASGSSIVAAANAAIIVVAAVAWPLSAVVITRTLLGGARSTVVSAGVLSAAFPAFPFLPLHYGVLYPLFLGLACMPVALAAAARAVRFGRVPRRQDYILLLLLVLPGLGVAHPGALLALLALSVPLIAGLVVTSIRRAPSGRVRVLWIVGAVMYCTAGGLAWWRLRPPADQIYWGVIETLPQAIGEVVSAAVYQYPVAWGVAALLVIGAYSVIRRPSKPRWIVLGIALVGSMLYVVAAGSTSETLRLWLTGPWYNNAPRLASIWVPAVLPLTALGATSTVRFVARRFDGIRRWTASRSILVVVLGAIMLAFVTQGAAIRQAAADIEYTHKLRADGPILTPDEFALIDRLPDLVPEGAVIAGDPYTGASFAYGMSGRRVLMPHLLMEVSTEAQIINTKLSTSGNEPDICAALERTGVRYVLDFSADGDFMDNEGQFPGLDGLGSSPFVELAAEQGDARLYRITSCGLGS
jgi:hypothetical protein